MAGSNPMRGTGFGEDGAREEGLPALRDSPRRALEWVRERWGEASPKGKGVAILAAVALIVIVAAAAGASGGSGGNGQLTRAESSSEFEVGELENLPASNETCRIIRPSCQFEMSDIVEVCVGAIEQQNLTGCVFEGDCVIRSGCECFDLPEGGECEGIDGSDEECEGFGACTVFNGECIFDPTCRCFDIPKDGCEQFQGSGDECDAFGGCVFVSQEESCVSDQSCVSSELPTSSPTFTTNIPSPKPTSKPTPTPVQTKSPTTAPSAWQKGDPTKFPTRAPTRYPTSWSKGDPTSSPTRSPLKWTGP